MRNLTRISVDDLTNKQDRYFETLTDEPKVGDYTPSASSQVTMAPSNSLILEKLCQREDPLHTIWMFYCSGIKDMTNDYACIMINLITK